MALLRDGNPNNTEDLRVFETEILRVAHVEAIDLDAKLRLAAGEVSYEVIDTLVDRAAANDPRSASRRSIGVSDVVVTPQLRRWHALHTLKVVYRDSYNNQLNDRYRTKWKEYRDLSQEAREQTARFGIGIVTNPIPRGQVPVFSNVPGLRPSTIYYVQVSWLHSRGGEGSPSVLTTYQTPEGSEMAIGVENAPPDITGWNVYVGLSESSLTKQNSSVLTLAETFVVTPGELLVGETPGDGQAPDTYVVGGRTLRRR